MAPVSYNEGQLPCNGSNVILKGFLLNTTSVWQETEIDSYDSRGAMEYIVTTMMVYSLMGISGLLLLRIRRRASRTHRVVTVREEHLVQYIKRADDLKLAGHRHKLKMDASRMVLHLQNLERQRSYTRSDSEQNNALSEAASLLSPGILNIHPLQHAASQNSCPNTPLPSFHELLSLPSLPEESTSIKSLHLTPIPIAGASFCNNCGAPFTDPSDRCQDQLNKWASHSQTSNNETTATGSHDNGHMTFDSGFLANKRGTLKPVTVTSL